MGYKEKLMGLNTKRENTGLVPAKIKKRINRNEISKKKGQ